MQQLSTHEADVVVVGGGPVRLMVACELGLAGVRVVVLERRLSKVTQSRALTIHGRSLEVLALRGIAERFTSLGRPIPVGHYAALDTRLDFSVFDSKFPFTLFLPQTTTEALLEERAVELGVPIHRGYRVTGLHQDGHSATVTANDLSITCRYVVGADGARSFVRQAAGIDFDGLPQTLTAMLGDVVLDSAPAPTVLTTVNSSGCVMLVPLGDGAHHRFVVLDPLRSHVPTSEAVTLDELATSTRRITGQDFGMRDPIWLSRFGNETRLAATYRKGRVLLAGDAAHIHMPVGGQGMNVGLQDAANLGWKLAGVIRGHAAESLLDSYDAERRPVGDQVFRNTLAQTALLRTLDHPDTMALRELMNQLLRIPDVNRRLADDLSGFGIAYPHPPLVAPHGWTVAPDLTGRRLPDVDLRLVGGASASLYELLHGGQWLALHFGASDESGTSPETALALAFPGWTKRADVVELPNRYHHLKQYDAVLVRPDGYGAFVRLSYERPTKAPVTEQDA